MAGVAEALAPSTEDNNMKCSHAPNRCAAIIATIGLASIAASSASAAPIFHDDFESGSLANWTGKSFGAHDAFITVDPMDPFNKAITFATLESAGEIFSVDRFEFTDADAYEVSFDYLGLGLEGSRAANYGGFVGYSEGTPGTHTWVFGTASISGAADSLVDDGAWRTYSFTVDGATAFGGGATGFHLMFEDFSGSGGVAGDAFFDNITVRAVPSPGASLLAAAGFLTLSRRRQRTGC